MQKDIDEIEALLMKWADWMSRGENLADDYPARSVGFIESWIKDDLDEWESADNYEMGKVNATIESLSVPHNRIIHKFHNVGFTVWSFPDESALYLAAKAAFKIKYFGNN